MRRLVEAAPVGRLATSFPDGRPHIVPVCFVLDRDTVFSAVDHKPKRTARLQRLANLESDERCSLLVDRYDDHWSDLWWVRLDGRGRVATDDTEREHAIQALIAKYHQYATQPPDGAIIAIDIAHWAGWTAQPGQSVSRGRGDLTARP
jgi:PPOX class probable F420-dependent enzyme